MGKSQQWNDVHGSLLIQFDAENPLRSLIADLPVDGELELSFLSSGYYDPGCMYTRGGDPGYPPEGDEERVPFDTGTVYFTDRDGKRQHVSLTPEQTDELFELYEDEIYGVELDFAACEDDEPYEP